MSAALSWSIGILAQATSLPATGDPSAAVQSVWDFLVKGGALMIPIGICSLIALAVIVERALSLRAKIVSPPGFMTGLAAALSHKKRGRDVALDYCRQQDSPLARVIAAAVRYLDQPRERIEQLVSQAGEQEVINLRKHLRTLSVIVAVAPMLGLLGTVFGMIEAFQTVAASGEALGRTEVLAKGIYEALVTTASGLMVAIPALIGFHWLSVKVERRVAEINGLISAFIQTQTASRPQPPAQAPAAPVETTEDEHASGDGDGDGVAEVETEAAVVSSGVSGESGDAD